MPPQASLRRTARNVEVFLDQLQTHRLRNVSAVYGVAIPSGNGWPARRWFAAATVTMVTAALGLLAAATAVYAATILFGIVRGDALPTATFSFLVDPTGWLRFVDRGVPYCLIAIAALGAAASWFVTGPQGDGAGALQLRRFECRVLRAWRLMGWFVIPAILLFGISSGAWSGSVRDIDYNYASLFGLVPFSDSAGYLFASLTQALHGEWIQFGARRPVAQAMRDASLVLGGLSYDRVLVVQAVFLGLALSFAGLRLAAWRGVWAGLAFVGLMVVQVRFLLPTTMTEPLGMPVALLSIGLLIDALRHRSTSHALLALTLLALALSIRMGAVLVLPVLIVWTAFVVAPPERRWATLAAGTALVVAVIGIGRILSLLYAPPGALAGGNFALTLCGLSVGSDWSTCQYKLYAKELAAFGGDEAGAASWALRQALRNIADHPITFVLAIFNNIGRYIGSFVNFYVHGYAGKPHFPIVIVILSALAVLPGLLTCLKGRAGRREKLLWAGFFVAVAASAAIIMRDNGWRALHVTHALTAMFLAFGFVTPAVLTTRGAPLSVRHWSAALVCGILLLVAAPKALQAINERDLSCCPRPALASTLDHIVGGRRMTGLVIVPDGTPRSPAVPSVPFGAFERVIRTTMAKDANVEDIVATVRRKAPVAFVYAQPLTASPRTVREQRRPPPIPVDPGNTQNPPLPAFQVYLLAPPDILSRRDVRYWMLERGSVRTIPGSFMTVYDVGRMTSVP